MKIAELASRTALNASAVRYYERCGLLALHTALAGNAAIPTTMSTACFSSASPATWGSLSARSNFSSAAFTTRPRLVHAGGN